jgi:hypothetical protein
VRVLRIVVEVALEVDMIMLQALGNGRGIANSVNIILEIHSEKESLVRSRWDGNRKVVYR